MYNTITNSEVVLAGTSKSSPIKTPMTYMKPRSLKFPVYDDKAFKFTSNNS